jgi:hypothetical protein
MKPVDVQNEDIKSFVRDITFLKEFINKEAECGTWRLETDEEEPNPMFKLEVCSACNEKANTTYRYCPNCGVKMITPIKLRPDKPEDWEPVESPLHTGQHSQ